MEAMHENKQETPSEGVLSSDTISIMMKEYDNLRAEILKRIELMHQLISLGLIVPGTIFAFGFQTQDATLILLYPLLAFILSLLWSQHDRRTREIGYYIHTQIETRLTEALGWEHFMDTTRTVHKLFDLDSLWAAVGVFAGTGILAILVGVPIAIKSGTLFPFSILLTASILSIIFTIIRIFAPYGHQKRIHRYSTIRDKQQ